VLSTKKKVKAIHRKPASPKWPVGDRLPLKSAHIWRRSRSIILTCVLSVNKSQNTRRGRMKCTHLEVCKNQIHWRSVCTTSAALVRLEVLSCKRLVGRSIAADKLEARTYLWFFFYGRLLIAAVRNVIDPPAAVDLGLERRLPFRQPAAVNCFLIVENDIKVKN